MDTRAVELRHQIDELEYKARFSEMIALCEYHGYDLNADQRVVALIGLRDAYFDSGDYDRAEQTIAKAIALARKEASLEALIDALCSAAAMNVQNAKFDAQLTRWAQEALTLAEAQNYARGVVLATVSLAVANGINVSTAAGLEQLQRVLPIAQKLPDRDVEAAVWSSLAQVYWWQGKPAKAAECERRVLAIHFQSGNDLHRAVALSNMASYHFTNWRAFRAYEQAMVYHREALALSRKLKYLYGELGALTGLGSFYLIARQSQEAVDTLEKVVDLARQHGQKRYEWQALLNLGAAYTQLKAYDRALLSLEQQLALADSSSFSRWDIVAHYQMGNVYQKQKRYQEALRWWHEALALEGRQPGKRRTTYYFSQVMVRIYAPYYAVRMRLGV
jgi:tetratricopeptide (TPR) repeat protein